jgi:translation initiation factor IF-2
MSTKKNKWLELGIITKNEVKDKQGNVLKNKDGSVITRLGVKLNEEVVEVLRKAGYDVTQYGVLTTPIDEVERLIDNGAIGEDKAEDRRAKAKEVYSWLRYKIQLPPPKEVQK